jgi:hypothetical protein
MNGQATGFDDELKALQIANARLDSTIKSLDIKLREFEVRNRPGFWKSVVASPGFLAAVIAVSATAGTALVSWTIAAQQRDLERTKSQVNILSGIALAAKPGDRCSTFDQLSDVDLLITDEPLRAQWVKMQAYYKGKCPRP